MISIHTIRNKQDTSGIFGEVNKAEINAIVFIQTLPPSVRDRQRHSKIEK